MSKIPFAAGQESGFDELAGGSPLFANCLVDGADAVVSRPGISAWSGFPAAAPAAHPVVAMIVNTAGQLVYVVEDRSVLTAPVRKVCALDTTGTAMDLTGADTTKRVPGTARPVMVSLRENVIIAGGGAPVKVSPGLVPAVLGGSPPSFNDITVIAQFLVGVKNDTSGQFFWAGPGELNMETWDTGVDFREAEYRPDPLVGCVAVERELFVWGTKTLEAYEPDADQIFAPTIAKDVGLGAMRSLIVREGQGQVAWLDHNFRFILTSGRDFNDGSWISSPALDKTLELFSTVSDCWGFRAKLGGHELFVWSFPTEGRTLVFDAVSRRWSEFFSLSGGELVPFAIYSHLWWPERRVHLLGMADGTIAQLTFDAHTDRGEPFRWTARAGFIGAEGMRTEPIAARFRVRRGEADGSFAVRWRDDLGSFCQPVQQDLGGDNLHTVEVSPVGEPYQARQYEISSTADAAFMLAGAWEENEVLEG